MGVARLLRLGTLFGVGFFKGQPFFLEGGYRYSDAYPRRERDRSTSFWVPMVPNGGFSQ